MKLQQLLEIIQTERINKSIDMTFDSKRALAGKEIKIVRDSGKTGSYARVYSAGNPHTVIKTNYVPKKPTDDPYLNYITYISDKNLAAENPFFPRIYKIQYLEDNAGNVKYRIEMEKLQDLNSTNRKVIIALLKGLFLSNQYDGAYIGSGTEFFLSDLIEKVIEGKITSKSELLNDAGKVIRIVKNEGGGRYDLFPSNIMIRLSPIPQLVITDPLA